MCRRVDADAVPRVTSTHPEVACVRPRAGESIGETAFAVRQGIRTSDIGSTTHPYPTHSDGLWNTAIADVRV